MKTHLKDLKKIYIVVAILFIGVFLLTAISALYSPYSGRANVEYDLYPIYSEISGKLEKVFVKDGDKVKKGDPLLQIDDDQLQMKLEELNYQYETEVDSLNSLDYTILEKKNLLNEAKINLRHVKSNYNRYKQLYSEDLIASAEFEEWGLKYDLAVKKVDEAALTIKSLEKQRGSTTSENRILKSIEVQKDMIRDNIGNSLITSQIDGVVSIHQLNIGQMMSQSANYGYIYNPDNLSINVKFLEKSISHIKVGDSALVVLDSLPGMVFKGHVSKTTSILAGGYTSPNTLYTSSVDSRWIRTSGRGLVKVVLDEKLPEGTNISSGSKAAVSIVHSNHPILGWLSHLWIRLIAILNFIY